MMTRAKTCSMIVKKTEISISFSAITKTETPSKRRRVGRYAVNACIVYNAYWLLLCTSL